MMAKPMTSRTFTAILFPDELFDRLASAAAERDLSINWLVNKAVEQFLKERKSGAA